ncbi:MAG: hypothetical protein KAT32_03165 [Candidatus Moranbacteria bacterium]|nr:hypothetical protein [Candidatus Moranbacteria bacterium]
MIKKGIIKITDNYTSLILNFNFELNAIPFNKEQIIEKECSIFENEKLHLILSENKKLKIQIDLKEKNLNLLYKIAVVISYILGQEIHLFYRYENHPSYNSIFFNLNSKNKYILKKFIHDPKNIILKFLDILENNYIVKTLLISMLQLGSISYIDIVFVQEYVLFEKVVNNFCEKNINGKHFEKSSDEYKLLEEFCICINDLLNNNYKKLNFPENKFKANILNDKGSPIKNKMNYFLDNFKKGIFSAYKSNINDWNKMRQIIHGKNIILSSDKHLDKTREMNNLLLEILYFEIEKELKK